MKKLLLILYVLSFGAFGQNQVGTDQIKDNAITAPKISAGSVTQTKLAADALRPVDGGAFSGTQLTFDQPEKKYTLTVSSDKALTLAASGNVAESRIVMTVTGDGSHLLTFPTTWKVTGSYSPTFTQRIEFFYDGTDVFVDIQQKTEIIEVQLTKAEVMQSSLGFLNLTFDNPITIDATGWTITATDAVTILSVAESGTAIPVFGLSRNIVAGETVTISYNPATGNTTSLSGNEIETITNFSVTVPPPAVGDACPGCTKYVDDDAADDIAAGTIGDPYKTITAAMAAAVANDVIGVRAGTYREGNIVCKANVTVREYKGETAIISGFDVVGTSGWTVHSVNIYKKTITLPVNGFNTSTSRVQGADPHYIGTTIFANQIIRNGVMMVEARWPNIAVNGTAGTDDLFDRTKYRSAVNWTNGFGMTSLTDAGIPFNTSTSNLVGATLVSNGWFSQDTKTILTHPSNTTVTYSNIWDNTATGQWTRARYYLTGKLFMLDAAAEWHYESGTLYFWQPGGGTPTGTIEYKARNYAFDARGKANFQIIGLSFTGIEPYMGDTGSTGALIDNIDVTFQNHHVRHDVSEWQGVGMSKQFGIKLLGANSIIKNSRFSYGGSSGIWLGQNCRAENNLMHDIGYVGYWANPISLWGTFDNQVITRNTIYNTGRSAFDFGYNFGTAPGTSKHYNVEVSYNHFYNNCLISSDGGATYIWGQCDVKGLNYHHNWIHDVHPREQVDGGINVGIYFDQATGPGKIHHNVTWNCPDADLYHETTNNYRPVQGTWTNPSPQLDIYNNTFYSNSNTTGGGLYYSPASYRTYVASPLDVQRNNIYRIPIVVAWQTGNNGNTSNSILSTTNPLLVADNINTPQTYFQLQSGSPARGIGLTNYAGATGTISDGHIDAGAYPYSDPNSAFIPGYVPPVDEVVGQGEIDDASSANVYTGAWTLSQNLNWTTNYLNSTIHGTSDVTAKVSTAFTGDHIEWWAEKRVNHGIVAVYIDGVRQDCDTGTGGTQDCDLYDSSTDNDRTKIFEKDLVQGSHTIELRATGTRNASGVASPFFDEFVHDYFYFESN